jgi:hypothetical protein
MVSTRFFPAFLLVGTLASLGAANPQASGLPQTAPQPPATPAVHRAPYSPFKEIHVDESCRLLPRPAQPAYSKKKPRLRTDPVICHLEAIAKSQHMEERIVGNEMLRNNVSITEQTYVLQNITEETAIFAVEQPVPQGWVVDSDPQPTEMDGPTAVFRVYAQPGEIVRLHVGMRRTKPLRSKPVKFSP